MQSENTQETAYASNVAELRSNQLWSSYEEYVRTYFPNREGNRGNNLRDVERQLFSIKDDS